MCQRNNEACQEGGVKHPPLAVTLCSFQAFHIYQNFTLHKPIICEPFVPESMSAFRFSKAVSAAGYLRCISGYEKGICATGVVIVVHCSCYIKGHELQGRDVPGQAAVAVVRNGGAFGGGVGYPARRDPAI